MTSARKIKANRENARASSGPNSAHGRANSTRNALRHGLSLPVYSDPALCEAVEVLAREIVGAAADVETQELARRVAEAQMDYRRVRVARHQLLSQALSDPNYDSRANARRKVAVLCSLLKSKAPHMPPADLMKFLEEKPEGPNKFATILAQEGRRLLVMDRYERRALSRRKFAIRALDEARRRKATNSKS
jgi:hypothetical protein